MKTILAQSVENTGREMELIEVDMKEFEDTFQTPYHCFNNAEFNELNKHKCDKLYYWLFKSGKIRLGLICGLSDGILIAPFSAPFGGMSFLNENVKLTHIEEAIDILLDKCNNEGLQLSITLPPLFYNETFVSKSINCLYRNGFKIGCIDLNYAYKLEYFTDDYLNTIAHRARKSLKQSFGFGLEFIKCQDDATRKEAYEIIKCNRFSKGYPLRMCWEQIKSTAAIIPVDFFILKDFENTSIASAIVFHVAEGIAQVIYWGDLQDFNKYRTMNHLSYKIFEHYKKLDYKYVDIGPSTENSIPKYGLCEFKESIGCTVVPKFSFRYDGTKG
jgi:hypothetical protein